MEAKFDPFGRRFEKKTNGGSTVVTSYFDGEHCVEERDGSDNVLKNFVYGQQIDDIKAMIAPDVLDVDDDTNTSEMTTYFYHHDMLGSVTHITSVNEDLLEQYEYTPYGQTTVKDGSGSDLSGESAIGNPYMFTARRFDEETGLYHYRRRSYDPEGGRFLQRDPLGYVDGPGLFTYVGARPTRMTDPLGLSGAEEVDSPAPRVVQASDLAEAAYRLIFGEDPDLLGMSAEEYEERCSAYDELFRFLVDMARKCGDLVVKKNGDLFLFREEIAVLRQLAILALVRLGQEFWLGHMTTPMAEGNRPYAKRGGRLGGGVRIGLDPEGRQVDPIPWIVHINGWAFAHGHLFFPEETPQQQVQDGKLNETDMDLLAAGAKGLGPGMVVWGLLVQALPDENGDLQLVVKAYRGTVYVQDNGELKVKYVFGGSVSLPLCR